MEIVSILFFVLAATANALMDTIQFHWYKFRWKERVNEQFWNPAISWRRKYLYSDVEFGLKYKGVLGWINNFTDMWHILKMIMIICLALSEILFPYSFNICIFENNFWNGALWLIIYGIAWNVPFNYCYNDLFVKK